MMVWGRTMRGHTMLWHQDNTITEANMNRMGAKQPLFMRLLRAIFKMAAEEAMRHKSTRITSEANYLSDSLSRGKMQEFRQALPHWRKAMSAAQANEWTRAEARDPPLMDHRAQHMLRQAGEWEDLKTTAEPAGETAEAEASWCPGHDGWPSPDPDAPTL